MKNNIDISVIIPAWNAAETIGELIRKILLETHATIELIVVNDGSTDDTGNVVRQIHDDRLILIEQTNQGVYAARNAALAIHRGEWVVFLDEDDNIADGFIDERWRVATSVQADVVIFNAWHSDSGHNRRAVHRKQPYGQCLSGHDWVRHCVTQREWPHYLWLQMVKSSYIRQHSLYFQQGKSHKDILWTVNLAMGNGRFCVLDVRDYTYISNTNSITHRSDYFDVRAISYIEVIAEVMRLAELTPNKAVRLFLYRHALVEARHFLGLYRNNVHDQSGLKALFHRQISTLSLVRGISSFSDGFFFLKLFAKLR